MTQKAIGEVASLYEFVLRVLRFGGDGNLGHACRGRGGGRGLVTAEAGGHTEDNNYHRDKKTTVLIHGIAPSVSLCRS